MKKIKTLLRAPVLVQSGYSVHSRQIFKSLIEDPLFDVHIESINWGHCSFLTEDSKEKQQIKECIHKFAIAKHTKQENWDLFISVTVPNEFERKGKFNVGVTAAVETDRVSHVWVQKCNEMDLIIVPSEHSKRVIVNTEIDWENSKTGEKGSFKFNKPIVVCNEGVDTSVFHKFTEHDGKRLRNKIDELKFDSDFNFLTVGQWSKGGYGEDRKNIANTVKYFIETFKNRQDIGLVLKINMARNSVSDYSQILNRLNEIKSNFKEEEIPPIYLLHGNLNLPEMASLYNHPQIKAFISLTNGEGFGLPLLEAAACGLPIMATNWSGHLDFLKKGNFSPVEHEMVEIPDIAVWDPILIKGSKWAKIDEHDAKRRMKKMVSSYSRPQEWAKELTKEIKEKFDIEIVCKNFVEIVKRSMLDQVSDKINPLEHLQSFVDTPENFNVLFTMPRSAGDVFVSTAVIDGLMKQVPPDAKLYFATSPQYADILKGNPHVYKVIPWNQTFISVDLTEQVFDLVLTPDTATQYNFSNWIRKGHGRLLAQEYANHCHCELGDYFIETESLTNTDVLPLHYMTFHPGSGKGQWEGRKYDDWKEVLFNIKKFYPDIQVVQVGQENEMEVEGVDLDFRGKTNYQQLARIIQNSKLHLSIDSLTMHMAAALGASVVALFGCSYAAKTGPWYKDPKTAKCLLLQSNRLSGCRDKACYKNTCIVNPANPPINEIDSLQVVEACSTMLDKADSLTKDSDYKYHRMYEKISGYTTTYNLEGYPYIESIKSMLGFCDEVVVVDGCSDDGTYEELEKLVTTDDRIQLYQNPWDFEEPGVDGLQKAFARALCEHEFLWQQDCDEVVHEDDYEKIKFITKKFPKNADILHLPIAELWGNENEITARRHPWKWRMSRNKPEITHGINKNSRLTNEKTGKIYAKKGLSDGCEYVNIMTYEMLPHTGFYLDNREIEIMRLQNPDKYADVMNQVFQQVTSVFHYSWCSIENKVRQFKTKWDKQWNILYQTDNVERFPGVNTDEEIKQLVNKLYNQGGEDSDQIKYKFKLNRSNPAIMKDWLEKAPLVSDE